MSVFNFETFGAGHIPPFGFKAHPRQTILSDDIEDVEYVDVSDPQPEPKAKRSYDRKEEIVHQAEEFVKKRRHQGQGLDPIVEIFVMSCFIHAAKWTDEHPLSSFRSSHDQYLAIKTEITRDNDEIYRKSGKKIDPILHLLELSTSEIARRWANDNPPKYY